MTDLSIGRNHESPGQRCHYTTLQYVVSSNHFADESRLSLISYFLSVNNVDVTVFLVSLKAGGVALNLTEASRVYLMDSWWNPAVRPPIFFYTELIGSHLSSIRLNIVSAAVHSSSGRVSRQNVEAMDRIHRLGQRRPVRAIKLVIEDSIESRIVQVGLICHLTRNLHGVLTCYFP